MRYLLETTNFYGRRSAILWLLTMSCLISSAASAQSLPKLKREQNQQSAGPRDGAGGELIRLDIIAVRNFLYEICDKLDTLKREKISCITLRAKMDEVGTGERLIIEDIVTLNDGKPRTARNRDWIPDITYSSTKWQEAKDNQIAKIGIQLHEYLGLLKIEDTDDYRVSSKVVNELRVSGLVSFLPGNDRASRLTFTKWAQDFLKQDSKKTITGNNGIHRAIIGRMQNKDICVLYVTDKGASPGEGNDFYLSLGIGYDVSQTRSDGGYEDPSRFDHFSYIGGFATEKTTVQMPNIHEINFRTVHEGGEWLNGSYKTDTFIDARLKIELTDHGHVWRVIGDTTLFPGQVVCDFR